MPTSGQAEHQLAVVRQRLELGLLQLEPRDVGQHGDRRRCRPRRSGSGAPTATYHCTDAVEPRGISNSAS